MKKDVELVVKEKLARGLAISHKEAKALLARLNRYRGKLHTRANRLVEVENRADARVAQVQRQAELTVSKVVQALPANDFMSALANDPVAYRAARANGVDARTVGAKTILGDHLGDSNLG